MVRGLSIGSILDIHEEDTFDIRELVPSRNPSIIESIRPSTSAQQSSRSSSQQISSRKRKKENRKSSSNSSRQHSLSSSVQHSANDRIRTHSRNSDEHQAMVHGTHSGRSHDNMPSMATSNVIYDRSITSGPSNTNRASQNVQHSNISPLIEEDSASDGSDTSVDIDIHME